MYVCVYIYDNIQNTRTNLYSILFFQYFNTITYIHTYTCSLNTCHYIFLHLDKYIDYNQNAEHF